MELIDEAANDKRKIFNPKEALGAEFWSEIKTLPSSISKLVHVKRLHLYGSNLLSIPPEIGEMKSLKEFDPYTSYGLHWFPYEITRCKKLKSSTVSTRALYGNYKHRPPFPKLNTPESIKAIASKNCSVCKRPLALSTVKQAWISLRVASDVLPLLVNACSQDCIDQLPKPADNYIPYPHDGGIEQMQPMGDW